MSGKSKSQQEAKAKPKPKSPPSKSAAPTKTTTSGVRRDALRKMLMERRQEVLKEIEQLIGHRLSDEAQQRVDSVPDVGDQALLDSERGRDISILEMRNKLRQNIDEALVRLDEGTYGICSDCGVEISEKRLKAIPFARRCVACQEKVEMLEKIEQEEDQAT
jgi:RNA polymerase-binding transcription factor